MMCVCVRGCYLMVDLFFEDKEFILLSFVCEFLSVYLVDGRGWCVVSIFCSMLKVKLLRMWYNWIDVMSWVWGF